jgi:hypothetical protein
VLLLLALLSILPVFYFYYLRPRFNARFMAERRRKEDLEMLDDEQRRAEQELDNLHVSNAVLDNCLSTLKHETMYYPSRIRQLVDQGDMESVAEVVGYYRDLYNLLSEQAMSQVERVKLHLRPLEHGILGDETLIRYLFDILKKQSGQKNLATTFTRHDDKYIEVRVDFGPSDGPAELFTPSIANIPFLLCRQIVRDHGEATNRRACSIRSETQNGITTIIIILPAYGKL